MLVSPSLAPFNQQADAGRRERVIGPTDGADAVFLQDKAETPVPEKQSPGLGEQFLDQRRFNVKPRGILLVPLLVERQFNFSASFFGRKPRFTSAFHLLPVIVSHRRLQ